MWRVVGLALVLCGGSGGAGADECRENGECAKPWSSCWTLGWCAVGHCVYAPLMCAAGSGCGHDGCAPAPFTLAAADDQGRFRLALTNTSGAPASVTVDARRVVLADVECAPRPVATTIVGAPATGTARKVVAARERVSLAVDLAWVVEAPQTTPFAMRYDVAKGSSCTATFAYRLDDGVVITAAPVSFKR